VFDTSEATQLVCQINKLPINWIVDHYSLVSTARKTTVLLFNELTANDSLYPVYFIFVQVARFSEVFQFSCMFFRHL